MLFRSKKLKDNPVEIQGNKIGVVEMDKYLGFKISSKGVEDSIRKTIDDRRKKAWSRLFTMKRLLRHPVIQKNGFLRSGIILFKAAIVPILMYSDDCWFGMSKNMINDLESIYRKLLYRFFDIPMKTKYEAVLIELGLMKAENIMASHKLCYINKIWKIGRAHV